MAFHSKNPKFNSVILPDIDAGTPDNPPANTYKLVNRDGSLYQRDSSGTEVQVGGVSSTLAQYNAYVGNSSNAATAVDTNLLGDVKASTGVHAFTSSDVSTGSDTITIASHGLSTGQKCYLTTTGSLPTGTGIAASTTLFIINASSSTVKLATTYALAQAGTAIDISNAGSGSSSLFYGGLVHAASQATVSTNVAQPGFYAHKNSSDQTWNIATDTPTKVTFGTTRWIQGPTSAYASSTYTVPNTGLWMVSAQLTFEDTTVGGYEYRLFVYKNGSRVQESEVASPSASPSGREIVVPRIVVVDSYAANDTIEIYAESNRSHTGSPATIKGNDKQTFFNMIKIA
jgi:hypothetical protein